MDRKRFLDLCQKYAVLSPHIKSDSGIDIPGDLLVGCDGFIYYPVAYKLSFDADGAVVHIAVLKERHANCIREVELKRVVGYGDK